MSLSISLLPVAACIAAIVIISGDCALSPPVSAIARAEAALNGLLVYFTQQESSAGALPPLKGCPCYTCAGVECRIPKCMFCSAQKDDPCPTKTTAGCYTTKKKSCLCNRPPGPVPPNATSPAQFFFACGQIGGLAPRDKSIGYGSCQCELDWPSACVACYRWWSAIALEACVNFVIESGMALNVSLAARIMHIAESMWIHSPYNADWNAEATAVFIDDFAWYSLAYLRVYDLTKDDKWRQRAAAIHDWAWQYGYDKRNRRGSTTDECGGFWWSLDKLQHFKDSITIVEVLHSAAKLATNITPAANRSHYLDSAVSIWNWIFEFDNGKGLLAPNGIMSTGAQPELCCSANSAANNSLGQKCVNSGIPGMTYNHGLLMSSAALLYNVTGKEEYLSRATAFLNAAYENLTNSDGSVRDLQRGARAAASTSAECGAAYGDPGSDFFSFKGIFVTHLHYFAETLNKSGVFTKYMHAKVLSIVANSSNNVWEKSIVNPPFKSDDACGSSAVESSCNVAPKYPKFHWWWTSSNVSIETPPNPSMWFAKTSGLYCSYNTSSVIHWKGELSTEAECKERCVNASYANCTKYMFTYSTSAQENAGQCPCFACSGTPCYQPHCQYCNPQPKGCPKKTSQGCYTTAKAGCTCTGGKPASNCWLYKVIPPTGFNREGGQSCGFYSYSYSVAARRPFSPPVDAMTSCKGRCGSNVSRFEGNSSMLCYCDSVCSNHLDCCLDYVDYCLPAAQQNPTCLNHCSLANVTVSHPIKGGGYCYCDSGCQNVFTDNNSYGGCCGDYIWHCGGGKQDQLCLDARTQTQAVSLFVAHHALNKTVVSDWQR
eukprot:m.28584 g.28584  ORF g.28584 m.28584 type:complete len:829 (+) comp30869_c0_seq1:20-2506(+)